MVTRTRIIIITALVVGVSLIALVWPDSEMVQRLNKVSSILLAILTAAIRPC